MSMPELDAPLTLAAAEPYPFTFTPAQCALVLIDMQRDFLEPGGFGAALGNDVSRLRSIVPPLQNLLALWRRLRLPVIHTREGHRADLTDLPRSKHQRGRHSVRIGDPGPMGRILVRGESGHALIPELAPLADELVIDKPGKGAFYATFLHEYLQRHGIRQLILTGVTTEVCVHTTLREANDRGYDCLVPTDCVASYKPDLHAAALAMITSQDALFGWTCTSSQIRSAFPSS